ncbi:MAG: outer membrane protein transport protein [Leptospiraceae bacterium]|nr:outer membrane protein transport protein [Leptospiraceae bacterium]
MKVAKRILFTGIISVFLPAFSLWATNGTEMAAYGARYAGMGGANLALGGSLMDLQSNPAHLAGLDETSLEIGAGFLTPYLKYKDTFLDQDQDLAYTNEKTSENSMFPVPYMGFTTGLTRDIGFGLALYGQGGIGANFKGITRPLNDPGQSPITLNQKMGQTLPFIGHRKNITENTFSELSIGQLTPGMAIRFGDFKIGLGIDAIFSQLEFRYTFSDPTNSLELPGAGYRYKGDDAYALSGKIGMAYDITDWVTVAYAYQAKSRMHYNGQMSVNAGDLRYLYPARVSMYLEFPEKHSGGLAFKLDTWTISFEIDYIKWSNSFRTVDFNLDQPYVSTPFGNNIDNLSFGVYWEDQRVYAVGLEYKPDSIAWRIGYNYGNSSTTGQGVNPIFPAITEQHVMLGFGIISESMEIDFAIEYAFNNTEKGSMTNDWTILHTVFGLSDIRTLNYSHETSMKQVTPHLGLKFKI